MTDTQKNVGKKTVRKPVVIEEPDTSDEEQDEEEPVKTPKKAVKKPVVIEEPDEEEQDEEEPVKTPKKAVKKTVKKPVVIEEPDDEETKEEMFDSIDLKFIGKHKKFINDHIETFARDYLKLIRPSNDKPVSIDAQSKDQIMYILCKLLGIVSKMDGEVPEEIGEWIEKSLGITTSNYQIYKFLTGVTKNIEYSMVGSGIEEKTLMIISMFIEDEDLMQHTVELFLLFIKRFSESLANLNWESTKKTNNKLVNGLLRNMNCNNTNPDIFGEIYAFATYSHTQNSKK
jgi:hypothetical protein